MIEPLSMRQKLYNTLHDAQGVMNLDELADKIGTTRNIVNSALMQMCQRQKLYPGLIRMATESGISYIIGDRTEMTIKHRVYCCLRDSPTPLNRAQIMSQVHECARTVSSALTALSHDAKYPDLLRAKAKGMLAYSMGKTRTPLKEKKAKPVRPQHPAMDGLYRGWYNPETGLTGDRLGV